MPKHPATSQPRSQPAAKTSRKSLTLETKLEIIRRHESGEKTNNIARQFQLAPSTVSTIFKSTDALKKAAETVSTVQTTRTTRKRDPAMDKMETMLELWITDQEVDPNPARSGHAASAIQDALATYREILNEKRRHAKQATVTSFFKPVSSGLGTPASSLASTKPASPIASTSADSPSPIPSPMKDSLTFEGFNEDD